MTSTEAPNPTTAQTGTDHTTTAHTGTGHTGTSLTGAPADPPSLFERIGGRAGLERIVPDVIALHFQNPVVRARFEAAKKPVAELEMHAIEFFATGLSGVESYQGLSMPEAHRGMGITEAEYMAVLDDILAALQANGVGQQEQAELLYIAYGMKSDIVGQ